MVTIKNERPGILIIPDAGLKLLPGESVTVENKTDQIKHALKQELVNRTEEDPEVPAEESLDLSSMNATEAIAEVNQMDDPDLLQGYLQTEKRKTVLDALGDRLEEVGSERVVD
jgi:hypothetical protein